MYSELDELEEESDDLRKTIEFFESLEVEFEGFIHSSYGDDYGIPPQHNYTDHFGDWHCRLIILFNKDNRDVTDFEPLLAGMHGKTQSPHKAPW